MAVTKRTRYEVLKRDNHACRYCGAGAPEAKLTIDHVVPVALGGSDAPDNLVTACADCNAGKSSVHPDAPLVEDVKQASAAWAGAMARAAENMAANRRALNRYVRAFEDELIGYDAHLPADYLETGEQFYRAGLPIADLKHAIAVAMSKRNVGWSSKFRYACGVAWTMIRQQQDEARRILEAEGVEGCP